MCCLVVVFWQTTDINMMIDAQLHMLVGSFYKDLIFPFVVDQIYFQTSDKCLSIASGD